MTAASSWQPTTDSIATDGTHRTAVVVTEPEVQYMVYLATQAFVDQSRLLYKAKRSSMHIWSSLGLARHMSWTLLVLTGV